MARLPRLYAPGQPQLITQRSLRHETIFRDADDYRFFQDCMRDACRAHRLALHAYALLPDRLYWLATPDDALSVPQAMQSVGRHYVRYFNQSTGRNGTLWEGRYRSTLVDAAHYLLLCSRFIETCPVRAELAAEPSAWPWSSHAHHVGLTQNPLITDHLRYWELGNTPFERQAAYRALFDQALTPEEIALLTSAAHKGWALGEAGFLEQVGRLANRRLSPLQKGRPRKIPSATGTEPASGIPRRGRP